MDLFAYAAHSVAVAEPCETLGIRPRDYQQRGIDKTFELFESGVSGVLFRQGTGTGKTISGVLIAHRWLQRGDDHHVLVLAHERQLIQQFAEEIRDVLGDMYTIAIEMGDQHCTGREQIIVASRQTLAVRDHHDEFGNQSKISRLYKFDPGKNWLLILDEAHRWAYKLRSCRPIIDYFEANPSSRRLGLTATPERTDKTTFARLFPGVASDYRYYDSDGGPCALRDGWAVPYDQRFITVDGVDFKNIREVAKDFDTNELEKVLGEQETLAKLVKPMLDLVGDRRTIIFNPGTDMARNVALYINALLGYDAAYSLDGSYPDDQRKDVYRRHQNGEFQFLSVCGLCIAKGTLVLTDQGEVPIENVTTDMKVWDGVEFVRHDGVIAKGCKPVIEYAGLKATEEHNVWTNAGWKTLAECKEGGLAIAVAGIGGRPVRESDGHYRRDCLSRAKEIVEVYDILNAGPRHRFTANGLIVSNCREGYNDPGVAAVAIFRPTKSRPLAEQMKGRGCRPLRGIVSDEMTPEERRAAIAASAKPNCMIIDLVGVTGIGDCASTAHILAQGKPDEVIERANENMRKKDGPVDVAEEIRNAERELEAEREKARLEREERLRREQEEMNRRAKLAAEVRYQQRQVKQGHGAVLKYTKRRKGPCMPFGKHKGEPIADLSTPYLQAFLDKVEIRQPWLRSAIQRELAQRRGDIPAQAKQASSGEPDWDSIFSVLRN